MMNMNADREIETMDLNTERRLQIEIYSWMFPVQRNIRVDKGLGKLKYMGG